MNERTEAILLRVICKKACPRIEELAAMSEIEKNAPITINCTNLFEIDEIGENNELLNSTKLKLICPNFITLYNKICLDIYSFNNYEFEEIKNWIARLNTIKNYITMKYYNYVQPTTEEIKAICGSSKHCIYLNCTSNNAKTDLDTLLSCICLDINVFKDCENEHVKTWIKRLNDTKNEIKSNR